MAYHARPCQFVTLSPLLLCIIHGYPPLGPVSLSSLSLLFVSPSAFLSFLFPSLYFLLLLLFLTPFLRVSVLQSVFLFVYFPWSISFLPTYPSHHVPLSSFFSLLSLSVSLRCDGDEWIRRIFIMRSHLSRLTPPSNSDSGGTRDDNGKKKAIANGSTSDNDSDSKGYGDGDGDRKYCYHWQ